MTVIMPQMLEGDELGERTTTVQEVILPLLTIAWKTGYNLSLSKVVITYSSITMNGYEFSQELGILDTLCFLQFNRIERVLHEAADCNIQVFTPTTSSITRKATAFHAHPMFLWEPFH